MAQKTIDDTQTFYHHIKELRKRLFFSALSLLAGAGIAYVFRTEIITYLKSPLSEALYYTTPAGGFNFVMKICFVSGLFLAIPVIAFNAVRFLQPALDKNISQKQVATVTGLSMVMAVMGAAFAFLVIVPVSLHFFLGFVTDGIKPLLSANDYLSFVLNSLIAFIIIFQLPIVILFINHIKMIPTKKMLKYERHIIVGSLVIALILPFTYDPLTQFLIALPIVALYNLSILLVWFVNRKRIRIQNIPSVVKRPAHMTRITAAPIAKKPLSPTKKPLPKKVSMEFRVSPPVHPKKMTKKTTDKNFLDLSAAKKPKH